MNFSNLMFLAAACVFNACAGLKPPAGTDKLVTLGPSTLHQLNGSYEVMPTPPSWPSLEWSLLLTDHLDLRSKPDTRIEIHWLDKRHMEVKLFGGEKLIASKIRKGRLKGRYFQLKPVKKISFFWLVLNGYVSMHTRVGLLENGNLSLDTTWGGCALLVFFPIGCGGPEHDYGLEFQRITY